MDDPQSELRNVLFWVSFVICQNVHIKFVSVYQETTKKERKQKNIICDRICEKVPFPHILHASKQNDVTFDSLY